MKKLLTLFKGTGDEFLLTDYVGDWKVSRILQLEDSLFDIIYTTTASLLLHKPGSVNITDYKIEELNEEYQDYPLHLQFESFLLLNSSLKLFRKFIDTLHKKYGFVDFDLYDYYFATILSGDVEKTLLSDGNLTHINNKEVVFVNYGLSSIKPYHDIIEQVTSGNYDGLPSTICSYPYDVYNIGKEVYVFDYKTGEHNYMATLDSKMHILSDWFVIIDDSIIYYEQDNPQGQEYPIDTIKFTPTHAVIFTKGAVFKIPHARFSLIMSKPVSNYYMKRYIKENCEKTEHGYVMELFIFPKRFNDINPAFYFEKHKLDKMRTNFTKLYGPAKLIPSF